MKKFISVIIFFVYLFSNVGVLSAVPSFGTIMPESGQWNAGGQVNLVFEREVENYDNAESTQYYYNLSFGFADWFAFDAKLGVGDIATDSISETDVNYRTNFAGGYGWRAKLFKDKKTNINGILGFEHISVHPSCKEIDSVKHDMIWDEWQMQALTFKELGNLNAYCGLSWSVLYLIRKISGDRTRRHSHDPIGLIVGTDLRMNDYIFLNVEGRFFDETALNTGFTIKY